MVTWMTCNGYNGYNPKTLNPNGYDIGGGMAMVL
jgi:hypothetical protein